MASQADATAWISRRNSGKFHPLFIRKTVEKSMPKPANMDFFGDLMAAC
jgi:hypothetical protein